MDNERVSQLLARIGREDQAAFRELYKAHSRKVFAYVQDLLNDHARAEEVLVDTMVEVWHHPARFRGDSQFTPWLIGIARRKAMLVRRGPAPGGAQPCIRQLDDEPRECLHLVFSTGLTLAEVAELQGCPEATVKARLLQARQAIKRCQQGQPQAVGAAA